LLARSGALARLIGFRSLARHPPCGRPSRVGRLFEHLARRHRITFARPRTPLGMRMPSAVAVFWFPTQNLVHEIGRAVNDELATCGHLITWSARASSPAKLISRWQPPPNARRYYY